MRSVFECSARPGRRSRVSPSYRENAAGSTLRSGVSADPRPSIVGAGPPTTSILPRPKLGSEHVIDDASTEVIAGEDRTAEVHPPIDAGIVDLAHHIAE